MLIFARVILVTLKDWRGGRVKNKNVPIPFTDLGSSMRSFLFSFCGQRCGAAIIKHGDK